MKILYSLSIFFQIFYCQSINKFSPHLSLTILKFDIFISLFFFHLINLLRFIFPPKTNPNSILKKFYKVPQTRMVRNKNSQPPLCPIMRRIFREGEELTGVKFTPSSYPSSRWRVYPRSSISGPTHKLASIC